MKELEELTREIQEKLPERCKHENLSHYEIIAAEHGTHYDDEGNVWFNNEYGNTIENIVRCHTCKKSWKVVKSSPKFIKYFHEKVQYDREYKMK